MVEVEPLADALLFVADKVEVAGSITVEVLPETGRDDEVPATAVVFEPLADALPLVVNAVEVPGATMVELLPKDGREDEEPVATEEPPVGPTTGELDVVTTTTDEVLFGKTTEDSEAETLVLVAAKVLPEVTTGTVELGKMTEDSDEDTIPDEPTVGPAGIVLLVTTGVLLDPTVGLLLEVLTGAVEFGKMTEDSDEEIGVIVPALAAAVVAATVEVVALTLLSEQYGVTNDGAGTPGQEV